MRYSEPSFDEMLEEAQERRENNEWALGPKCPKEGILAHALLKHLIYENEVNQEEENIDVYSMFPLNYDYYDLTQFKVLKEDISDRTYAVGNERDTKDSVYNYLDELIDDVGIDSKTARRYLNAENIAHMARDLYNDWVYQDPESYLPEEDRLTSHKQDQTIELIENKISKLQQHIEQIESHFAGKNENEGVSKINHLEELIGELQNEIDDIKSNPDGEYNEAAIERQIEFLVDEAEENPAYFLDNMGLDAKDYFNRREYIEDVIDSDGYGILSSYDGNSNEVYIEGEIYYVFRID